LALAAVLALSPAGSGQAGHRPDSDQDRARAALEAGKVVPLQQILDEVTEQFSGKMIQVALQDQGSRLIYLVTLLTEDGQVVTLHYDARTATLLNGDTPAIAAARSH